MGILGAVLTLALFFFDPRWLGAAQLHAFVVRWGHCVGLALVPQTLLVTALVENAPDVLPARLSSACTLSRDLAFGVYMLQTFAAQLLFDVWLRDRSALASINALELIPLFLVLIPAAAVAHYGVQVPIAKAAAAWMARDVQLSEATSTTKGDAATADPA